MAADYLQYQSFDDLYHRLETDKVLINRIDIFNQENKAVLDAMMMRNYEQESISIIPSCQCGELKGGYYLGNVCHRCNTHVTNGLDDAISFLIWLERPQQVERFISPIFMANLLSRYKITRPTVPLVAYIIDPGFKIDKKQQKTNLHMLERLDFLLAQHGIQRSYNSFVSNFFQILEILESEFVKKTPDSGDFIKLAKDNYNNIFSNYLPFPNKILFASETNELGRFVDKAVISPLNTIRRLTGIDLHTKPSHVKQLKVGKSLIELAGFYTKYIENVIFGKPGLIRQQITATRTHFSGRAVITSIPGVHDHDELHLPWSLACTLLRPFIIKNLIHRGMSYREADNYLIFHNRVYSQELDNLFKEMIQHSVDEDGRIGIKFLFNRNPSLHRGSIQVVRGTLVKPDPDDHTFSMSPRIGPSFNSDHDGDEMNLYLILTSDVLDAVKPLEPYHNVLGLSGPNEISNNIKMPKTLITTFANYFNSL